MKKTILFSAILAVLTFISFHAFAAAPAQEPKLVEIKIVGPDSVPENTQNVFCVVAVYDDGSQIEVTADANVTVVSEECEVLNLGGIIETFKLKKTQKQFTICANYHDLEAQKPVTIFADKK